MLSAGKGDAQEDQLAKETLKRTTAACKVSSTRIRHDGALRRWSYQQTKRSSPSPKVPTFRSTLRLCHGHIARIGLHKSYQVDRVKHFFFPMKTVNASLPPVVRLFERKSQYGFAMRGRATAFRWTISFCYSIIERVLTPGQASV